MAKRIFEEEGAGGAAAAKRRRRSIIPDGQKNPSDAEGKAQCFKTVTIRMHVAVAPEFSFAVAEGVQRQHLDPLIMNYYGPAGGVVIAHSNLQLLGQDRVGSGPPVLKIINDSPFGWIWIKADLLVWAPATGDLVEGWISVQSPGHIALLIHDTFNATIRREDIPNSWVFVPSQDDEVESKSLGHWKDASGQAIDGKLPFTVKVFNFSGRTVLVQGSLLTGDDVQLPTISSAQKPPTSDKMHVHFGDTAQGPGAQVPTPPEDDDGTVPVEQNSSDEEDARETNALVESE